MIGIIIFAILIVIAGAVFLAYKSFLSKDTTHPKDAESFLNHLLAQFTPSLSVGEVELALHTQQPVIVLDVREQNEFASGHIPKAINIPEERLHDGASIALHDKKSPIYVYCKNGHRGAVATRLLRSMGYKHALNIIGGLSAWQQSGYPQQSPAYYSPQSAV